MTRADWWKARGSVLMAAFAICALIYADNWAKKIFGFLIAGGCALYDFQRVRARELFKREERAQRAQRRRIAAESDED